MDTAETAAESMFTRPGHWPWLHLVRWHHRVLGWNGLVSRHEGVNGEQTRQTESSGMGHGSLVDVIANAAYFGPAVDGKEGTTGGRIT